MDMPVVFVDPLNVTETVDQTFTVSIKIFNLTSNFYVTDDEWFSGDPLPPPGFRYTYSMGNLYSFEIVMSWDPTVLEYQDYEVMIPVETYPDGILNEPADIIEETLDETEGTFVLACGSAYPAEEFNCANDNATMLEITFKVVKEGACYINLDDTTLYQRKLKYPGAMHEIPHWRISGQFRTPGARTRIVDLKAGALVGAQMYNPPLILGEEGKIEINIKNDGMFTDTYNLTLYNGTTPLHVWETESLEPGKNIVYNHTLEAEDLSRGLFSLSANATIMHGGQLLYDSLSKQMRVVNTPLPEITLSPASVVEGQTVTLDASQSTHQDLDGSITNYTWTLYEPGTPLPRQTLKGKTVTYEFDKNGTWTIILEVKDNWGLTYDEDRSATDPYKTEATLDVAEKPPESPFNIENIALVIIIIVAIALILYYIRQRTR